MNARDLCRRCGLIQLLDEVVRDLCLSVLAGGVGPDERAERVLVTLVEVGCVRREQQPDEDLCDPGRRPTDERGDALFSSAS